MSHNLNDQLYCKRSRRHSRILSRQNMIVTVLLSLIITVIITVVYNFYVHFSKYGQIINQIPGPKYFPIIGNLLDVQKSRGK